jgi:hypothetical protein
MEGQEYYKEDDENSYIVPGDMRLSDFYNLTNFDIEDSVMATIGGVAFRLFDKLPIAGDKVTYEGYEFVAKEVKGLRISQVQVRKVSEGSDNVAEAEADEAIISTPEVDTQQADEVTKESNVEADVSNEEITSERDRPKSKAEKKKKKKKKVVK